MEKNLINSTPNKNGIITSILFVFVLALSLNGGNLQASEALNKESKALDLLSSIDAFSETDSGIRLDAAKAHYNMGNVYFQKGMYEIAVREYYQAVTLMPDDPDSHYNLAFVSSEHLRDYKTALKHYRMYLYLNPNANDKPLVQEKILQAQLELKSLVDSPLEDR